MHPKSFACATLLFCSISACSPETTDSVDSMLDPGPDERPRPDAGVPPMPVGSGVAGSGGSREAGASGMSGTAGTPSGAAGTPSGTAGTSSRGSVPGGAGAAGASVAACVSLNACCSALLNPQDRKLCQGIADNQVVGLCVTATDQYCSVPPSAGVPPAASVDDCARLAACCASVEDDAEDCQEIADAAAAADCTAAVPEFCAATTVPTTPNTTPGDPCNALTTCCSTLSDEDDQSDCQEVAEAALAGDCRASLAELCPMPTTTPATPGSGACTTLDAMCCATLEDDENIDECTMTVRAADPAACQAANDTLCAPEEDD